MSLFGELDEPTPARGPQKPPKPTWARLAASTRRQCDRCAGLRYVAGAGQIRRAAWRRNDADGELALCHEHTQDQHLADGTA